MGGSYFCRVPECQVLTPVSRGWGLGATARLNLCWLCLPSLCSPEDAFSWLRNKWCPVLKCPLRHF